MEEADLIIFVMDASLPLENEDCEMLNQLSSHGYLEHSIILLNKMDLTSILSAEQIQQVLPQLNSDRILSVSARREEGLDLLAFAIERMFSQVRSGRIRRSSSQMPVIHMLCRRPERLWILCLRELIMG